MSAAALPKPCEFARRAELIAALSLADPSAPETGQPALQTASRALQLARELGDARSQALAAAWRCMHQFRRGAYAEVVAEARTALTALHAQRLDVEERELLRVLALAANETARFDLAIESAQQLVDRAATLEDPGATLAATFVLAACLERMGDSWQAMRVLKQALAESPAAPDRERMIAHNGLLAMGIGLYHRLRDLGAGESPQEQLEPALEHGLKARALLRRLDDPIYAVTVLGNLGEVLTHLGRLDEAGTLLEEALRDGRERALHAHVWRISATLAEWQLASQRPAQALQQVDALLAELGAQAPQQTLLRLHGAGYRAAKALGRAAEALAHHEAAERLERQRTISQLQAQSRLFVTKSEVERARRDARRQRARAAEMAEHAVRDPLTGIGNRRHLDARFEPLLSEAQRQRRELSVALLDVDHFKRINDGFGHATGDRVLVTLAQLLAANVRGQDVLARMGGEEFVIVLPGMDAQRAAEVCERLAERIRCQPWPLGVPQQVTASIGVAASTPQQPLSAAELLQRADEALYEAKRSGRDRVVAR